MNILITGAHGFMGRNLATVLSRRDGLVLREFDVDTDPAQLEEWLVKADVIFHLAGINRPPTEAEFKAGNRDFTAAICETLERRGRAPILAFSSSIQAALDNPYGRSKREAEEVLAGFAARTGARVAVFRFKNVFGKWCRPNYNSVTATFCHNIAHDLPIAISDPNRELELVYIDDVVAALAGVLDSPPAAGCSEFREVPKSFRITLGALAETLRSFRDSRRSLLLPALGDELTRDLYATYLSYLDGPDFAYDLTPRSDPRGTLAEFVKSPAAGQIFVSRTHPGITRGNHFHHTKTEKFFVIAGDALIRFRPVQGGPVIEHRISGDNWRVVDIPPGYTHSITNVGQTEMIVIFWASEPFDPTRPDTYALEV